ncbi:T9SS sorting signal type C domain-containing protein [Flavobacterium sp. PLA-1-15]|uniref:T9SS sorting signal type C domain-containing protein n=1 Tax=Flavobacterium sp. PLA-1-15 TaxID=3380533 RepID=UPI003B82A512
MNWKITLALVLTSLISYAQEINVRVGTTSYATGTGTYTFATAVPSGNNSTAVTFNIQNTQASTTLNLTANPKIAVGGVDESMFTVNESATSSSIAGGTNTTFTVTFSPTSVGAKEAFLTIENDDADESTYIVILKGTGLPSKASSIITTPSYVYPTNIPYINYQADDVTIDNSVEVGSFTISDGNGTNDTDNLPTTLTNITFALSNSANIRSVALYDGVTEVGEDMDGAASITFSDLSLAAPDNGTKTFTIRVTYNELVTDGIIPVFTVTAAGALSTGSTFAFTHAGTTSANGSRAVTSSTSPNNRIDVVATKLEFVQEPSDTDTFVAMAPAVTMQAVDALGNRDTGYHTIPVILTTTGSFNTVGTPVNVANRNTASGLATFASIVHNTAGTGFTLTATSTTLAPAVSTEFDIGLASGASNYFRSRVVSGDWGTASSWETSHNNVDSWIVSTLVPNQFSRGILIQPGHTITCTTTIVADQIIVETGATLTLETGANFTLNNGATDLTVRGTFNYNNGTFTQATGARASFGATGVYNHNIASATLTFPNAAWNAASICNIIGLNNVTPITASNANQSFGILNWNNPNQGAPVVMNNSAFKVLGKLNIGTTTSNANNIICINDSGTHTNTITGLNLANGKLIVSNGTGSNTLALSGITTITGGEFIASKGSGTVTINATNVFNISAGKFILIDNANSGNVNFNLSINRNFNLSGTGAVLLENVSSSTGVANLTLNNSFVSTSLASPAIDFGTGDVTGNVINVRRNFSKTENGTFTTSSATPAKGFVFFYAGTQTFNYTGTNSSSVSYTVNSGTTLSMSSNLTFGSAAGAESVFTVLNGGRINLGARVITGNATHSRVAFESGSTLSTTNTGGIGGVGSVGSFQGFASVNTTPATGRLSLPANVNYILAGSTTTPFPVGAGIVFGNPATVTTSANITSNMTTPLTINTAFNVLSYTFKLASGSSNNLILNNAALNVTGAFDNNGENQVLNGGGSPSVNINGRFITRDEQGFVGANAAIPTISPVLGPISTIEYGRAGAQPVQASPSYANLTLTGSGTKTLLGNTAISTKLTIASPVILEAQTFAAGGASTALTMTGTSQYKISGTGVKPDAAGTYTLASTSKIEFYGAGNAIEIRLGSPTINYGRIDINGTNISNNSATQGIQFVAASAIFTVKNGATFKFKNTDGFTGSTSTAISNAILVNPILEAGSTVEYAGADQTITPYNISTNNSYKKVAVSGTGTKTLATDPILVRDNLTVTSSLLKIEGNKSLTVTNGITTVDNTATEGILVEDDGSLVQVTVVDNELTNNNTGKIKVMRTTTPMYRYDFTYWGSPVKGHTVKDLSPMTLFDKFMSWNAATSAWVIIPVGAEAMVPGKGYAVRAPQSFSTNPAVKVPYTGSFTGVPNNGNVTYATFGNGASTPERFNLLGNPYPSAIDIEKFLLANNTKLEGTIYLWTHNTALDGYSYNNSDYAVYNFSGPTTTYPLGSTGGATKYLAAGQGFYVKGISAGASTVTFTNAMREVSNNNNFFRPAGENSAFNQVETTPEKHRVWLNLRNNEEAFNQTLVGYIENATNGIDWGYDGPQFGGTQLKLYSIVEDKNFTIQGKALPFTTEDEVPLGYQSTIAGPLNISIDHYDGLFEYQNVYLEDKLLNIVHNLKESEYAFTSEIGTFDERFVLRYAPFSELSNPDHEHIANGVSVYKNNNQITVKSQIENIQNITVYDLLGRQVFNAKNVGTNSYNITDVVLNEQPLIVRATLVNGQVVNKKIVY